MASSADAGARGHAQSSGIEEHDVLVLGAGLSGIFLAYHLRRLGTRRFAVLDRRADVGGMWAELRFPGLRTDSPLGLYGYSFHASSRTTRMMPTRDELLEYFREVVDEHSLGQYMRFGQHVKRAEFDSQSGRWQLTTSDGRRFRCQHVMNCTGYFDLFDPYIPEIPGMASFSGRIVHTHSWRDDVEYEGKRVVLVGSGATAVTAAPALAESTKSLIMLQRSPSYIRSGPLHHPKWSFWTIATRLVQAGGILKTLGRCIFRVIFWWMRRNALWETKAFNDKQLAWSAALPEATAARERDSAAAVDAIARRFPEMRRHFTPEYPLFEQRTGFAPGDEFFSALQQGRLRVVTAHIDSFTPTGIRLRPLSSDARAAAARCGEPEAPEHLEADLVVLATGHKMSLLGDVELVVDGRRQLLGEKMAYRGGLMTSEVPNMFHFSGYFKGTYTQRLEAQVPLVLRILRFMHAHGLASVVPRWRGGRGDVDPCPQVGLITSSAGYADAGWRGPGYAKRDAVQRRRPGVGTQPPWRGGWNYYEDWLDCRSADVEDGVLEYSAEVPGA